MRSPGALAVLLAALAPWASALEVADRRRDQFGKDFSYYFYPIAADIPGLGRAGGGGASILNIARTDADFTGFYLDGDFKAAGYALLDLHLLKRRLLLDTGYYNYDVAPVEHKRGIRSSPDDYILPEARGWYALAQVTGTFWERRLEVYYRGLRGRHRMTRVRDKEGRSFPVADDNEMTAALDTVGGTLDLTDDRLDPRRGLRLELLAKRPFYDLQDISRYFVTDYNLTAYFPLRRWDSLVFNVYGSDAHITHQGPTDYATLQKTLGLGCSAMAPGPDQDRCTATEKSFINERIAFNRHGIATALGGTQRLRSFDNSRFMAGHSFFYGLEYRWNLTDERTPFNILIAKGVRTGLQAAFYVEQGTVFEEESQRWQDFRTSYGAGFRVVLSGVILRADVARGGEGSKFILFITYPWSIFSVDNPY